MLQIKFIQAIISFHHLDLSIKNYKRFNIWRIIPFIKINVPLNYFHPLLLNAERSALVHCWAASLLFIPPILSDAL